MVRNLRFYFQSSKSKTAFSLLEVIISLILISILMLSLVFLKDIIINTKAEEKMNNYYNLYDASLFIVNKIKMSNAYKIIEIKDRYGIKREYYVFESYEFGQEDKEINYYYFTSENGNLKYKAYNGEKNESLFYNYFSNNQIIGGVESFELTYEDGLFDIYIKDESGDDIRRAVLSGAYNE